MKILFVVVIVGLASTAVVKRRASNSYGDEPIALEGGGAQQPMRMVPEEASSRIRQPYSSYSSGVQSSGYRVKKASNSYGDEQVLPQGGGAQDSYKPVVEQASAQVQQYPSRSATVVSSGYRKRRNSYGDEMVTPAAGGAAQGYHEMEEKPAEAVEQHVEAKETVHPSGY